MEENPNSGYYRTSQGSITGFDTIVDVDGNPDIVQTGWSLGQLQAFLLNESNINFPTEDWVLKIDQLISSHLVDFDNPHKVTLNQIIGTAIGDLMNLVTPGTPPSIAPFFSFDAMYSIPLGDIFPATYSTSNLFRMNEGGVFVDVGTEIQVLGTDYVNGRPGVPLFSSVTNMVPSNWATLSTTPLGSIMTKMDLSYLDSPFQFYALRETGSSGSFGVLIPTQEQINKVYTATFFVSPTISGGSIVVSAKSGTADTMTVDLSTGSFICSSNTVMGETVVYSSGMIKVSFTYVSKISANPSGIRIVHQNEDDTTPVRIGEPGRPLFSIGMPQVSLASLDQPIIVDNTKVATCSPLVLKLDKVPAPISLSNLMVTLSVNLEPMLPASTVLDTTIFTMGALTITRDQTKVYVNISGNQIFSSDILKGVNNFTLSYSPSQLIFKDFATPRQTAAGVFPALSTSTVKAGPCYGYLNYIALYAMSDKTGCVEYLTNG